jgi:putative ABC transport system permease protein
MSNLKGAFRFISAHPGFSSLIVLTMALGIGLNSAVFSIVDGILLRPMAYKDSDRLYRLLEFSPGAGSGGDQLYFASYQSFMAWRERSRSFDQVEAMGSSFPSLTSDESPENVPASSVSDGFFTMLGAKPALGRLFVPADHKPGAPPVAVLGQEIWQRRFGRDPGVLGRPIVLDGQSYTIVGIMQPRFFFRLYADLYLPLTINAANPPSPPGTRYLYVTGHLRPGVSFETAKREGDTIIAWLAQEYPAAYANWGSRVMTVRDNLVGDLRPSLITLAVAAAFLLLIACANVSNLLLNKVVRQRGELALRSALGATRGRLIQQIVTESTLLALLGGALGTAFATAFVWALPRISPTQILLLPDVRIDYRVIIFTILVSLLCGLLPGLFVAFRGSRLDLYSHLRDIGDRSSGGVESRRLQSGLVVAEVALTLMLLVCCGLVLKSFARLSSTSPGFDAQGLLTCEIALPSWKYGEPDQIRAFWSNLLPRVESLPGVAAVGITHVLPVNDNPMTIGFEIEGRAPTGEAEALNANFRKVTPGFFNALRAPLIAGRVFDERDDENHPLVAIISQEMARRFWPDADPLGKQIKRKSKSSGDKILTVVGVLGDIQDKAPGAGFGNTIYVPLWQDPKSAKASVHLLVRTQGQPLDLAPAITREILAIDPNQPIKKIVTMDKWIFNSLSKPRFSAWILTVFAAFAVLLSVVGIYSVLSYNVSRRQHEIGVRLAFGARARDVIKIILWQGMSLTSIGIVIGLVLAVALSRLLTSQLYQVKPSDPIVFAGIVVGLSAVALLACYLPARRATRIDPIRSLNPE